MAPPYDSSFAGSSRLWYGPGPVQAKVTIVGMMVMAASVTVQEPGVTITSPEADASVFYSVPVKVQAGGIDWLTLWLDGKPVVSLREPPYAWTLDMLSQPLGPHHIEVEFSRGGTIQRLSRNVLRSPDVPEVRMPSGELPKQGVSIQDGGFVTLTVDAPDATFVSLIGDFNDWDPAADVMTPAGDGRWWMRKTLREKEVLFQYMVDGAEPLADPFSREVRWMGSDSSTAKTLSRPIPPRAFVWTDRAFKRPALRDLVVYEMAVGDANTNRGFRAMSLRLKHLKSLGMNAVGLLPLAEYPGEAQKGYNPAFPFAVENSYGTPREFKDFVNKAHGQGIAVILDMVFGQTKLQEEAVLEYWIKEFHLDGIRYHEAHKADWESLTFAADVEDPGMYQFLDHASPSPALVKDTFVDAVFQDSFSNHFRDAIRNAMFDPAWVKELLEPEVADQRVLYVESRDQDRLFRVLRDAGYTQEEIVRRVGLAHAILLTVPGVVSLQAGQEFGEDRPNTNARTPLNWGRANIPPYRFMLQNVRALIRLRREHPACRQDKIRLLRSDAERGVLVYQRHAPGNAIVVAANFGRDKQEVDIPLPADWRWVDVLAARDVTFDAETGVLVTLAPGQARVFTATAPAP